MDVLALTGLAAVGGGRSIFCGVVVEQLLSKCALSFEAAPLLVY